ncbi:MAG: MFS transporter [Promethearchaeota archaeon]|nr:MAG: MFS transporter [Candidatus Lokiarchaeota archaeon]
METTGFSKGTKWSFGMGSFAQWFINSAFNVWVFTFYFTAVGLPVTYIMLAYIVWTVWNAFNDPLLGYISDRTRTKWGRRKPFIVLGTIAVLIIEVILWLPPTDSHFITFIYLLIMLILYDTFYTQITFFDSLFPEMFISVKERAEVNTIKQILATVGLIFAFLIPGIFIGDLTRKEGYLINGIVTSIIIGISLLIAIKWGIKEREEFKLDHKQEFGYFQGLKYAFKNKGFVLYTIMFFLYEYILLTLATTIPLYALHVLGVTDTFLISLLLGVNFIAGVLTVIIWMKLDVKLGSRKAYMIAVIVSIIAFIPFLFIATFTMALIFMIFSGIGMGGMLYFIYLIVADPIDNDELETGIRREGTFFGITNFFMRLSMILSIVTVSLVFSSTGWESYTPNPRADVIFGLKALIVIFPGIAMVVTLILLYFYPYTKERVAEMKSQLAELHAKKKERVSSIN